MIRAQRLERRFGRVIAVEGISLDVEDGALLALLGPNGAGKTTTIRMLAGLLAPTGGEATVAGCDIRTAPASVRARVGFMTDAPGLHDQMTPVAYLDFYGRIYGLDTPTRQRRIADLLELFDLQHASQRRMVEFSRGMQQKVALARALLHAPDVLFLDEPTAGLDPLAARTVRDLIVGLKHAQRSIVLCTHDLDEAERLADHIVIMSHGRIVAQGAPRALRLGASAAPRVEVQLAEPILGVETIFGPLSDVHEVRQSGQLLTYQTAQPEVTNPAVVAALVRAGAAVISVTIVTRSLEEVYASVISPLPTDVPAEQG